MGKKSRKAGKKSDKNTHREKVQERRERQEDWQLRAGRQEEDYDSDESAAIPAASPGTGISSRLPEIFPGDRVWFWDERTSDETDYTTFRGFVTSKRFQLHPGDGGSYRVLPLCKRIEAKNDDLEEAPNLLREQTIKVCHERILPDSLEWVPRFKVGQRVLCGTRKSWKSCIVKQHFAPDYLQDLTRGKISKEKLENNENPAPRYVCSLEENEAASMVCFSGRILEHKDLRFAVGDAIQFAASKAKALPKKAQRPGMWINGTIAAADVLRYEYYVVYECAFDWNGRSYIGHILTDEDEYVAASNANPRERLLESIEQDCSYEHIDHLVKTFDIDVEAFQDLAISKAMNSGSYSAILWLQENLSLDVRAYRDKNGNTMMHLVAVSPHAISFLKRAGRMLDRITRDESPYIDLGFEKIPIKEQEEVRHIFTKRNNSNETFLHTLIREGNLATLSAVFSRGGGLGWSLAVYPRVLDHEFYASLRQFALEVWSSSENQKTLLCAMLDEFEAFRIQYNQQSIMPDFVYRDKDPAEAEVELREKIERVSPVVWERRDWAIVILRFYKKYQGSHWACMEDACVGKMYALAQGGLCGLFRLFFQAGMLDESDFPPRYMTSTSENLGEFTQPEVFQSKSVHGSKSEDLDLVMTVVHGEIRPHFSRYHNDYLKQYFWILKRLLWSPRDDVRHEDFLISRLQLELSKLRKGSRAGPEEILKYKLRLLRDDVTLIGRIKVLDYLVSEQGFPPPDPIDALRYRQCGVLRWLVEESFVDLDASAVSDRHLAYRARYLDVVSTGRLPSHLTIAGFLCFAAVEFDDLQSLKWLTQDRQVSVETFLNGWTIVHACAFFGRIEIILWLQSLQSWPWLRMQPSRRRGNDNLCSPHIAVQEGHVLAAEALLNGGCPYQDKNGHGVDYYARKSKFKFVREWAEEQRKPAAEKKALEKDIEKLVRLIEQEAFRSARKHIIKSRCLDFKRWIGDDNIHFSKWPTPILNAFFDTVLECCSSTNESFSSWLIYRATLTPSGSVFSRTHSLGSDFSIPPNDDIFLVPSVSFREIVTTLEDDYLSGLFAKPWSADLTCTKVSVGVDNLLLETLRDNDKDRLASRFQSKLVLSVFAEELLECLSRKITKACVCGDTPTTIEELLDAYAYVANRLRRDEEFEFELEYYYPPFYPITVDGRLDMTTYAGTDLYSQADHPFTAMRRIQGKGSSTTEYLYQVIAVEGYLDLISWCSRKAKPLDFTQEIEMVRISSYFGHEDIVDWFLSKPVDVKFSSNPEARILAAFCGAAESGRVQILEGLIHSYEFPDDPIMDRYEELSQGISPMSDDYDDLLRERKEMIYKSIAVAAVSGFLDSLVPSNMEPILHCLAPMYNPINFLKAASFILRDFYRDRSAQVSTNLSSLFLFLCDSMQLSALEPSVRTLLIDMGDDLIDRSDSVNKEMLQTMIPGVEKWLAVMMEFEISIQVLGKKRTWHNPQLPVILMRKQSEQLEQWSRCDIVKQGAPLSDIQNAFAAGDLSKDSRDKNSMQLTHIAAAYDRPDILAWLIHEKEMSLTSLDGKGRTVEGVAQASMAQSAIRWVSEYRAREIIARFVRANFYGRLAHRRARRRMLAATVIQSSYRGIVARRLHARSLAMRMEERQRYNQIWKGAVTLVSVETPGESSDWSSIREETMDIAHKKFGVEDFDTIDDALDAALATATQETDERNSEIIEETSQAPNLSAKHSAGVDRSKEEVVVEQPLKGTDRIQLSTNVVKWLESGDKKYRQFFVRRMKQLASGDRSRILAKRLKGSSTLIYETYLEQKSGFRILWTPPAPESSGHYVVWYVAKHHYVSRLVSLIDDSQRRSARQRLPAAELPEFESQGTDETQGLEENRVVLNPLGNVPLKLYDIQVDGIDDLAKDEWVPTLHLTKEERNVVEAKGTVLLLGRSGTGKTVAIISRMEYDRQRWGHNPLFSQLFVARSTRLCKYVEESVGSHSCTAFSTFGALLLSLTSSLPLVDKSRVLFLPSNRMDFARFKRDLFGVQNQCSLDPLIVWMNIRTFIKGSIESISHDTAILPREEYVDAIGKRRCRLSREQRTIVYNVFEQYQKYMTDLNLWDDCDRIVELLGRLRSIRSSNSDVFNELKRSKIYVDEIQDYTQIECLLFFLLSGPGDLFLAGDPAQSVVEGVDFRFEEIRAVGYYVAGPERRELIPQKPMTVNINFRSHSGILNAAASVLRLLFKVFPGSAKQLKEDRGLFQGPRPGVLHKVYPELMSKLVREKLNGVVILAHDSDKSHWKRALGGYPLVYGIREAKGLEFKSVICVDFFVGLPRDMQKPWRDLLLGRARDDFNEEYPEVEGHLKLLYTMVTRCIEKLFFAESTTSVAGDAFVRWITTATTGDHDEALATRNTVDNIESMTMSRDDWMSSGLDSAQLAEEKEEDEDGVDLGSAEGLLDRAIYCFEQAKHEDLARKARAHRASIRFRSGLPVLPNLAAGTDVSDPQVEMQASRIAESLLKEKLVFECMLLIDSILPHVTPFSRERLQLAFDIDNLHIE